MISRYAILLLLMISSVYSYDFARSYWGDSEEEVIDEQDSKRVYDDEDGSEVIDLNPSVTSLTYKGMVSHYYAEISYLFKHDKLFEGWYRFDFRRDQKVKYYKEVAQSLLEDLKLKYGNYSRTEKKQKRDCNCQQTIRTWKTKSTLIEYKVLELSDRMPEEPYIMIKYFELNEGIGGL